MFCTAYGGQSRFFSFHMTETEDSNTLHVSAGCGKVEGTNVLLKLVLLYIMIKMWCHSFDGGCTKWQFVGHLLPQNTAAKLRLTQFLSSQVCN